ncbi:MAG: ABC transporter substrate-binding protein [Oceanospirillaceae bacterium]|nr:ABC transporter substrate-binding protein [Oceanospirillaceae bacterium]
MPTKLFLCAIMLFSQLSFAQDIITSHAIALRGEPNYPADFKHWDYVNPNAIKAGHLTSATTISFDNFNRHAQRGLSAPNIEATYDTIMVENLDEDNVLYCLICESISYSDDFSWVEIKLNPKARFQDDKSVLAADIAFTFNKLIDQGVPFFAKKFKEVSVQVNSPSQVKFSFAKPDKKLLMDLLSLTVFPEHFWSKHDLAEPLNTPPLGSGAYTVKDFKMGQHVVYQRDKNYWAKAHPTKVGLDNFDFKRFDIYKDSTVMIEAFKKGEFDINIEYVSKLWKTAYTGKNIEKKYINLEEIPNQNPQPMQAFIFNTTRPQLSDRNVRQALGLLFDFEWTNKTLFYGVYQRNYSYFQNSDYMARGIPKGRELEILTPYKAQLPPELFNTEYNPPKTDGSGRIRRQMRQAIKLFKSAGWNLNKGKMLNAQGEPFKFELMMWQSSMERIAIPFKANLAKIGVELELRTVDIAQATNRLRDRKYDMIVHSLGGGVHPRTDLRLSFQSKFLDSTYNNTGYSSELTDHLIDKIIEHQQNLDELKAYGMALDRVLLWQYLVIPQYHSNSYRVASWNKFSRPAIKPRYASGLTTWWFDAKKAAALPKRNALD